MCNEYPPRKHGGIGTFVSTIAPTLVARGHEVTVVEFGNEAGARTDQGVRVVTLRRRTTRIISWLWNRAALWRWIRRETSAGRIEILESPEYEGWLPFPWYACPVVLRLQLSTTSMMRHAGVQPDTTTRLCEWATVFWHRCWIATSRYAVDVTHDAFRVDGRKVVVSYYPVDVGAAVAARRDAVARTVVYSGRVSIRKGALDLASAMNKVWAGGSDAKLQFVGPCDPAVRAKLDDIIDPRWRDNVDYMGHVTRAESLRAIAQARCMAFPSSLELFGLVVAEAMLLGCPVIVPRAPPFTEFLTDGVSALLVDSSCPDHLHECIERVLTDEELARTMAANARRFAEEHMSVEAGVRETLAFYHDVMANLHSTSPTSLPV